MAAETISEFLIGIGIDPSGIDKGINNVVGQVKSGLSSLLTGAVMPALAGLASGEMVKQFTDEIVQVDTLSKSLGMNIEQLSAWRTAAEMAGIEADEVGEIFSDFNDWMLDYDMNDSGSLKDFIDNGLIPSVRDANGEMKKTEDYLLEVADAAEKLDPAAANGMLRQMSVSNLGLANFIQQGGTKIRESLELAKEIGVYTQEDAKIAGEFDRSLKTLSQTFKMMLLPVYRAVTPLLTEIAKGVLLARKHIRALTPAIIGLGIALAAYNNIFSGIAKSINAATKASLKFIFSPWGALLMALLAIGIVLDDFLTWLDGGESAWSEYYEKIFGDTENAKQMFQDFYSTVVSVITSIGNTLSTLAPHFQKLWAAIKNLFTAINNSRAFDIFSSVALAAITLVIDALANFLNYLVGNGDGIAGFFEGLVSLIASAIDKITAIIEALTNEVNYLNEVFSSVFDFIFGVISGFISLVSDGINNLIALFNSLMEAIGTVGDFISGVFNAMSGAFNSFVGAVVSGASSIIQYIQEVINKVAELASNSLFGKILGAVGGSIAGVFNVGGNGGNDYSTTYTNTNNYFGTSPGSTGLGGYAIGNGIGAY